MRSASKIKNDATPAWLVLAGAVCVYDLYAVRRDRETLSAAFHRGVRHPVARWPVIACWAYLTAHLFVGPSWRSDPFRYLADRLRSTPVRP